jgi:DnaJ-class molecular chaperone
MTDSKANEVVEAMAELQLAAFLAGRGSVTSMQHGTRTAKPAPTMDEFRSMAAAALSASAAEVEALRDGMRRIAAETRYVDNNSYAKAAFRIAVSFLTSPDGGHKNTEICPQCDGSGFGVAGTICNRCNGSGGVLL